MKQHSRWIVLFGTSLVLLSALVYFFHYLIFRDPHHIFVYLVGDIAFVPIEVLLVTLILHRLLENREKKNRIEKMNMVIEVFFSDAALNLMRIFAECDPDIAKARADLLSLGKWQKPDFAKARQLFRTYAYDIDIDRADLESLRDFLTQKRGFLVQLWGNPYLLEHSEFSETLRSVLHLTEELSRRSSFSSLPASDRQHLRGDMKRAYTHLTQQWIDYLEHLKINFPYLYSLAVRTNPFDEESTPVVT